MKKKTDKTEKKQVVDKRKTMPHLFKKGQSGNPNGRPKGSLSITTEIKRMLSGTNEKDAKIKEFREIIWGLVKKKKWDTIKTIWNYVDGMPKQSHQIEGEVINKFELNDEQFEQLIRRRTKGTNSNKSSKG